MNWNAVTKVKNTILMWFYSEFFTTRKYLFAMTPGMLQKKVHSSHSKVLFPFKSQGSVFILVGCLLHEWLKGQDLALSFSVEMHIKHSLQDR